MKLVEVHNVIHAYQQTLTANWFSFRIKIFTLLT